MLRLIAVLIQFVCFLVFEQPLRMKYDRMKKDDLIGASWAGQKRVKRIMSIMLKTTGTRLTVKGEENIPKDESVLFVSNHRSYFDIVSAYAALNVPTGFISKDALGSFPLLRDWMKTVNCFFLDRSDIRQGLEVIKGAAEQVKKGISVWVCPEGTRGTNEDPADMLPFHEASFKVAERSGCLIVPVAITGTRHVFEDVYPRMQPGHIVVEFGKPYRVKDLGQEWKKKTGAYTAERIADMLRAEQKLIESEGNKN